MSDAQDYRGVSVAVTGASGYLASEVVRSLQQASARITLVSRKKLDHPLTESIQADIRTPECWRQIVETADVIFHLAGTTSVAEAAADPSASLQATVAPIAHLEAAARFLAKQPRVVFTSTATVYGLTTTLPVSEAAAPQPITVYDLHKLFAERELQLATVHGLLGGVSLRLANVYGPSGAVNSASDRGILNRMARLAANGEELTLFGGGKNIRDYIFVEDVVRAILVAGLHSAAAGQTFNVASGRGVAIRDAFNLLATQTERATGQRIRIRIADWPPTSDPIERRDFVGDPAKFAAACGWSAKVGLEQGIERLLNSILTNRADQVVRPETSRS